MSNLKLIQKRIELSDIGVCAVKQLGHLDFLVTVLVEVGYYLDRLESEVLDFNVEQSRLVFCKVGKSTLRLS